MSTLKNCILIINKTLELEGKELIVFDINKCMLQSKYFFVEHIRNDLFEYSFYDNVNIEKIDIRDLPVIVEKVFESKPLLECLDIVENNLQDSSSFYIKVADKLSVEEYNYLKSKLLYKKCHNCMILNCRNRQMGIACDEWDNKNRVGRCKVLNEFDARNI